MGKSFVRTTLYNSMVQEHGGEQCFGPYHKAHPMVLKMLEECDPIRPNKARYEEFISRAKELLQTQSTFNENELRQLITPQKFFEHMRCFAAGMQYAAHKLGKPVSVDEYKFSNTVSGYNAGEFQHFVAAAIRETSLFHHKNTLHINPAMILHAELEPHSSFDEHHRDLNAKECEIITAVEEMIHLFDMQHLGLFPSYDLRRLDMSQYHVDPMEKNAKTLVGVAVSELKLGQKNRGPRR